MSCLHPRLAYYDTRTSPARVLFRPHPLWLDRLPDGVTSIAIPCGKCFGCHKSRALDITVRAVAESRMHDFSSFITLTVDDNDIYKVFPPVLSDGPKVRFFDKSYFCLDHRPWQLFAKRLRKRIGPFTFLMCGEYGSRTLRPHYHAIIYGHKFVDSGFDSAGHFLSSFTLRDCWPYGNHMVGDCNTNRVAYVAGYTCKDYAVGRGPKWYDERGMMRPYVKWSRRPALGLRWFELYKYDLVDKHNCLSFCLNGKTFNFGGRYFFSKFALTDPELYDSLLRVRRDSCRSDAQSVIERAARNRRACELKQHNLKNKGLTAYL